MSRDPGSENIVPIHAKPKRRSFSTEYKLRILEETDRAEYGETALILRREGLYSTHLSEWRRWRKSFENKKSTKKAARSSMEREVERLRRDNQRLQAKLDQANLIIELQKN